MPAMKRPASKSGKGEAKRGRRADPNTAKYQAIAVAVERADGYPAEVRHMLASNVKVCLSLPKDTRHAFAEASLVMVHQVLQSSESAARAKVEELEKTVGASDAERTSRDAKAAEAEAAVTSKTEAAKAAQEAFDAAVQESHKAAAAAKEAKREQHEGDAELEACADRKAKLEDIKSGTLQVAKESPSHKHAKAFVHGVKHFGFDDSLIKYAEETLSKAVEERGTFDNLILRELDHVLGSALSAAAEMLSNGESAKAAREAKVKAAEEAVTARTAEQEAAKLARDEAKAALAGAQADHKAAVQSVKHFWPEIKKATADLDAAKKEVEHCLQIVASFEELRDRTTPPPAAEEPQAEADAAAEGEAPEPAAAA